MASPFSSHATTSPSIRQDLAGRCEQPDAGRNLDGPLISSQPRSMNVSAGCNLESLVTSYCRPRKKREALNDPACDDVRDHSFPACLRGALASNACAIAFVRTTLFATGSMT
jgi:hypothetical protein